MSDTIASLVIKLGLDAAAVQAGLKKSEQQVSGFASRAGNAMRVAGGLLGGGLAFAAKGALEMEDRAARFQAETGASAEEAAHFADVVNAAAGRSLVGMDAIADSATKVRTDLGLMGAEADATLQSFLDFERATSQGAAAVLAFDDILDSWNLEASESAGIMDVLVKSHQLYGGSIEENQRLLAQLAPALQAANMSWEEGQGLLNLFSRAGVGGEAAATAFNRALGLVKSPEELRRLLEDISAIEDPFERAQKAAQVFGSRAGTKLGQALSDAEGDLGRFIVSVDDAAGATKKAADALDNTITSKFKLALNQATALVRGFGMEMGPILTGAMSTVWLAQSIGLGKIFGPMGAKAAAAFSAAFGAIQTLLAPVFSGLSGVASRWGAAFGISFAGGAGAGGFIGAMVTAVSAMAPLAIPAFIALGAKPVLDEAINSLPIGQESKDLATGKYIADLTEGAKSGKPMQVNFRWPWEKGGLFGGAESEAERLMGRGAREWQDMAMAMVTRGTEGAIPEVKQSGKLLVDTLTSTTDQLAQIHPTLFAKGSIADPIRDEFADARQAILSGFGGIKDALKKGSRPQLISRDDRIANMEKRQGRINKQLNRAVAADDPFNVRYWASAAAKQQVQLDRLKGRTGTGLKEIKRDYRATGIDIGRVWGKARRATEREATGAADTAISEAERIRTSMVAMDFATIGSGWMTDLAAGITSNITAVSSAAATAATAAQTASAGARAAASVTPGGSGGGNTTYVVGTLIADDKGLDELDRRIERRRRVRDRGPMRYRDD
jgi:hypothetical protein